MIQLPLGIGGHAEVRRRREEVIDGGGQIQRDEVVAMPCDSSAICMERSQVESPAGLCREQG